MSVSKKTGIYLSGVTLPIVEKIMQEQGFTKMSTAINFIIIDYDKIKNPPPEQEEETQEIEVLSDIPQVFRGWFVEEDKQS